MIIQKKYICSTCGEEFNNEDICRDHEEKHYKSDIHLALYDEHGDMLAKIETSNPDLEYIANRYGKDIFFVHIYDEDGNKFFNKILEIYFDDPGDEYEPGIYLHDGHEWFLLDEQIQWLEDMKEYLSR